MKVLLITLNLLSVLLILLASHMVHDQYFLRGMDMYVALDRAEIINREKLKESYPDQIKNDRVLIPRLFYQKEHPVLILGIPCAIGFLLNARLIGVFWKSHSKPVHPAKLSNADD